MLKDIKVQDILNITNGELILGDPNSVCKHFSKDTRDIQNGDTYIGIKGNNFDGNLFWKDAFHNGANCVIVENIDFLEEDKTKFSNKIIIRVNNTLDALYEIAKFKRNMYDIPVIAVTGSVGKTSTKDLIAKVVSKKFKTLKTISNHNNNIGLPFTILELEDHEALVLEMGMNHFGEIKLLSSIAKPNICVITNIGTSHIGNLGSRENILKAKLEILENSENPTVIINNDNDLLHKWYTENYNNFRILTYGINTKSDIMAEDIQLFEKSSKFSYNFNGKSYKNVTIPIGGEHAIINSLCAITVGETLTIDSQDIITSLTEIGASEKKIDIQELSNGIWVINDAYNASFESIQASLKYLKKLKSTKKIIVLGDILELGVFAQELHEKVGKEVAKSDIDILICHGENAKYIAMQAEKDGFNKNNIYVIENRNEILKCVKKVTQKGDVVLFKASNGMKFSELATLAQTTDFWES